MNSKILRTLAVGLLATVSSALVASPSQSQNFFNFAKQGKLIEMINLAKTGQILSDDLYIQRDDSNNTLISAAIQGYPLAVAAYGDAQAKEYLETIVNKTLLPLLPKTDAVAELLNLQNNQHMTALLYAGKNGLLQVATMLHSKGANPILPDASKKMSDFTPNLKTTTIARSWEKYQMDNVEMASDKFAQAGEDIKDAFTGGPDPDSSLALKIADLKKNPPVADAQPATPGASDNTESATSSATNAISGLFKK